MTSLVQSLFDKAEFDKQAVRHHNARVEYDQANAKAQAERVALARLNEEADHLEARAAKARKRAMVYIGVKGRTGYGRLHLISAALGRSASSPNDTWSAKGIRGAYAALFISLVEREADRIFEAVNKKAEEIFIPHGNTNFALNDHEKRIGKASFRYAGDGDEGWEYRARLDAAVAMGVSPEHFSYSKLGKGVAGKDADRINCHELADTMGLGGMTADLGYEQIAKRVGEEFVPWGFRRIAADGLLRDSKLQRWPDDRRLIMSHENVPRVHVDELIRKRVGIAFAPPRKAKKAAKPGGA